MKKLERDNRLLCCAECGGRYFAWNEKHAGGVTCVLRATGARMEKAGYCVVYKVHVPFLVSAGVEIVTAPGSTEFDGQGNRCVKERPWAPSWAVQLLSHYPVAPERRRRLVLRVIERGLGPALAAAALLGRKNMWDCAVEALGTAAEKRRHAREERVRRGYQWGDPGDEGES